MDERQISEAEAAAINDDMARQMELRRQARPERRRLADPMSVERRKICSYCFQPGDHPTAAHCLRALERSS